jgi:hypothetical protein
MNLNCPKDFYVHIDCLAFQAKQDGMDFAIRDGNGISEELVNGRVMGFSGDHSDWDFNPGVRFGVGFYLDHDAWNLDFNWTWLNITNYSHASAGSADGVLLPFWLVGSTTGNAQLGTTTAGAVWKASYNTLDIRLAKPYHVSRYLVFNPHFGIRAGWIDQHFSVDYSGVPSDPGNRTIHHGDNNFWGVGSRAGLDTDLILGKGWCLFGNVAASMLFGKFEIEQELDIPDTTNGFTVKYDFYQNVPNFEIVLGLGWGSYFDKDRCYAGLKLAYEFHEWFDQLNMRKFTSGASAYTNDVVSRGNLTLNGFSLKLQLDI